MQNTIQRDPVRKCVVRERALAGHMCRHKTNGVVSDVFAKARGIARQTANVVACIVQSALALYNQDGDYNCSGPAATIQTAGRVA